MVDISTMLVGFGDGFLLVNLFLIYFGIVLGQYVGAVPGNDPIMAMAIGIPFTFGFYTLLAIALLADIKKVGLAGGAVPVVLMSPLGTPDTAATAMDGYPLAKQSRSLKALKTALFSSVTGDTVDDVVLITVSAPLAILALKMGPMEIVALMIFVFSILAGLTVNSLTKGIVVAALGLLVASFGQGSEHFTLCSICGHRGFFDGIALPSVAIGMLAISESIYHLSVVPGNVRLSIVAEKSVILMTNVSYGLFGIVYMLILVFIGYLMSRFGYSMVIFIIAIYLASRFEKSTEQSLE